MLRKDETERMEMLFHLKRRKKVEKAGFCEKKREGSEWDTGESSCKKGSFLDSSSSRIQGKNRKDIHDLRILGIASRRIIRYNYYL